VFTARYGLGVFIKCRLNLIIKKGFGRRTNQHTTQWPFDSAIPYVSELLYIWLVPLQNRERKATKWGRRSASPKVTISLALFSAPPPPPTSFKANRRSQVVQQFILREKKTRNIISAQSKHNTVFNFFCMWKDGNAQPTFKNGVIAFLCSVASITETPAQNTLKIKCACFPTTYVPNNFRSRPITHKTHSDARVLR